MSKFFFSDRVEAVTPKDLADQHHHDDISMLALDPADGFGGVLHGGAEELHDGRAYSQEHQPHGKGHHGQHPRNG